MSGPRIGVDHHDRLVLVGGGFLQCGGQAIDRRIAHDRAVDLIAAVLGDGHLDLFGRVKRLSNTAGRQVDLEFGETRVGRGHCKKDHDDEQDVDERNQVDFRVVLAAASSEIHSGIYFRSPWTISTSLIACCSMSTTSDSTMARK